MYTLVTCLLLCCVQTAVSQQCGVRVEDVTFAFNAEGDPKIAPWAVSIGYVRANGEYRHHCSGSIINGMIWLLKIEVLFQFFLAEKAILTAAHCIADPNFDRYIMTLNLHRILFYFLFYLERYTLLSLELLI